jgi:uncharacterized membrane protein YphA (DoxX/SURF4 family)
MTTTQTSNPPGLLQKISYYAVLLALVLIFIPSAYMKLSDADSIVANFSKWNLLDWKNIIAGIEIAGVLLLLIPRTTLLGCLLLSGISAGAAYTHFQFQEPMYFPLAIFLVIWINYLFIKPKKIKA